jgi:hypothetical protein
MVSPVESGLTWTRDTTVVVDLRLLASKHGRALAMSSTTLIETPKLLEGILREPLLVQANQGKKFSCWWS